MRENWRSSLQRLTAKLLPADTHLPVYTVQYHPEAVGEVLDIALACGDMNQEEREAYDDQRLTTNVSMAFQLSRTLSPSHL